MLRAAGNAEDRQRTGDAGQYSPLGARRLDSYSSSALSALSGFSPEPGVVKRRVHWVGSTPFARQNIACFAA